MVKDLFSQWGGIRPVLTGGVVAIALAACGGPPPQGPPPPTAVQIAPIETATIRDTSTYIATLQAQDFTRLQPQVSGRVNEVYVQLGDRVSQGEPILQLSNERQQAAVNSRNAAIASAQAVLESTRAQLAATTASLGEQEANVELAQERLTRNQGLLDDGVISQDQLDEARRNLLQAEANLAAQEQLILSETADVAEAERLLEEAQADAFEQEVILATFQLRAPFDGIVGDVLVKVGDYVSPETVLTTLSASELLEVNLNIPLERAPDVAIGTPVEILDRNNGVIATSEVSFISPSAEISTQSLLIKSFLDNASGDFRADQFVRARLVWNERPSQVVPVTAVTRLGGQSFVYVAMEQEGGSPEAPLFMASQQAVQLGQIQNNAYEVVGGLTGDEQLVVTGVQKIFDSAPIQPEVSPEAPPEASENPDQN